MKREKAKQLLMDTLSYNEQMLIEEIETLPNRLIDAMIQFAQMQGQSLPIDSVSKTLPDGDDIWCKASEMSRDNFADWYDNL